MSAVSYSLSLEVKIVKTVFVRCPARREPTEDVERCIQHSLLTPNPETQQNIALRRYTLVIHCGPTGGGTRKNFKSNGKEL